MIEERSRRLAQRLCVSVCCAGIALISLACAVPQRPQPVAMAPAEPQYLAPAPNLPAVHRSTAPWTRQRLGYTPLVYELPAPPEVLGLEDDATEIARLNRDGTMVHYEVRSAAHPETVQNDTEQLIVRAITRTVQRLGGTRREEVRLTQSGYPGVELRLEFPRTSASLRVRLLVGHQRSYLAMVSYPAFAETTLRADADHFLQSLELDPSDLPRPDGDGALGEVQYAEPVGAMFAIRFPGRPRRETGTFSTPALTRPRITYSVGAAGSNDRWEVSMTAFERRRPNDLLPHVRAALTANGWTVRNEQPSVSHGYAGRAFTLERASGSIRANYRVYVTQGRLYEVLASSSGEASEARDARVRAFFDSFRVL